MDHPKTKSSVTEAVTVRYESRDRCRRSIENFVVIWLDTNEDYARQFGDQLRRIVNKRETFTDPDQCIDYITNRVNDEHIFLITVPIFGELIANRIHELVQLNSIYIFNEAKLDMLASVTKYWKTKRIFTRIDLLCDQLSEHIRQHKDHLIEFSLFHSFSTISSSTSLTIEDKLNKQDASDMYAQLFKEIITGMVYTNKDKQDMIDYCRLQYEGNQYQVGMIDEFERDYDLHSPIWWYTRDGFIHKMLNKALFQQDIDTMYAMRVFIKDLHWQLVQLSNQNPLREKNEILTLYRGQKMRRNHFEDIKTNLRGLISFYNFLSTSGDREVALLFAGNSSADDTRIVSVLFQITVDLTIRANIPFANIDALSNFSGTEKEYLFSMGTIFRIGEIQPIQNDNVWHIHLTLTNDNDSQLASLTQYMRQFYFRGSINLGCLGRLMIHMSHFEKAKQMYQTAIESITITEDPRECAALHNNIGLTYKILDDWNTSLVHYRQALKIERKYLLPNDLFLAVTLSNLATLYLQINQIDMALKYTMQSLQINLNAPESNDENLAINYECLGSICVAQNNFLDALKHYEHARSIRVKAFPSINPHIGVSHNNIGFLYAKQCRYIEALNEFNQCLQIELSSLTSEHHFIAVTLNNIAYTQNALGQYQPALTNSHRAVEISTKVFGIQHSSTQKYKRNIDMIHESML